MPHLDSLLLVAMVIRVADYGGGGGGGGGGGVGGAGVLTPHPPWENHRKPFFLSVFFTQVLAKHRGSAA